jgi:SAM-dependent methyltransferase
MLNLLRKLVPRFIKRAVRRRLETRQRFRLFGALAPLVPSTDQMFDGTASLEEFKANGEEFLRIYRTVCALQPDEKMLDVGSGIGRKTIPLTQYLSRRGSYEGIDVNKVGVRWCEQTITRRFSNFHFQSIDVHNRFYNPMGACSPTEYRFPFADGSFTFVAVGSVFTHMMPVDVEHYLSEIFRVLAPGRCLISYFLLNEESRQLIARGHSSLAFGGVRDGYATVSSSIPETAIAFEESFVTSLYAQFGFNIDSLYYGSWCGRDESLTYQDLIVATKA